MTTVHFLPLASDFALPRLLAGFLGCRRGRWRTWRRSLISRCLPTLGGWRLTRGRSTPRQSDLSRGRRNVLLNGGNDAAGPNHGGDGSRRGSARVGSCCGRWPCGTHRQLLDVFFDGLYPASQDTVVFGLEKTFWSGWGLDPEHALALGVIVGHFDHVFSSGFEMDLLADWPRVGHVCRQQGWPLVLAQTQWSLL